MNILITGSSGFVGSRLIDSFIDSGYQVTAVDAMPLPGIIESESFRFILADTTKPGQWQDSLQNVDTVINLAGTNIFHRWMDK